MGRRVGGTSQGNFAMAGVGGTAGTAGGAGTAATDATTAVTATVNITTTARSSAPLVLPGLLTAAETEGALPVDRVYFTYSYFDRFRVGPTAGSSTITGVGPFSVASTNTSGPIIFQTPNGTVLGTVNGSTVPLPSTAKGSTNTAIIIVPQPGTALGSQGSGAGGTFNLNRFEIGLEKTFFDGQASVFLHAPALDATDNTSGQPIDGFGDISAGFKVVLRGNPETGGVLTAGFTAAAPTARDTILTTTTTQNATLVYPPAAPGSETTQFLTTANGTPLLTGGTTVVQTTRINPAYLQPWIADLLVWDRLFVQEYIGAIVPTDMRIPVYINENLVGGFDVYRGSRDAFLTAVSPFVGTQVLVPVSGTSFHFPDQVFLSAGLGVQLGQRLLISGGYVTPVAGPKAFDGGATMGVNFFF
jgi:hypothetical protein